MTEEMEVEITPADIDGQLQSVFYQRTFNLGNYENEKIGVVVKALQGQTYEALLNAAKDAVMKDHEEYDDLREKYAEANRRLWDIQGKVSELKRQVKRLEEEKAKLAAYIEGVKVDHPEVVQAIADAELKVGDRVAMVGTLTQIDPDDKKAAYYVTWDSRGGQWVSDNALFRVNGIPEPEETEAEYPEDDDYDFEDEDEEDDQEF